MIDIPAVIVPMVTEYVEMRRKCTCGKCAKGEFPKEVSGTVSNILKRMRKKAQLLYERIRQIVENSTVVGADESNCCTSLSGLLVATWVNLPFLIS